MPGVEFVLSTVGADSQQRVNFITLFMQLTPLHERKETQQEIMQQARRLMAKYSTDLRVAVQYPAAISGGGVANADLLYTVRGPDLQKLTEYSERIRQVVKQIPGVVDVDSSLEVGKAGDSGRTLTGRRLPIWASAFKTLPRACERWSLARKCLRSRRATTAMRCACVWRPKTGAAPRP